MARLSTLCTLALMTLLLAGPAMAADAGETATTFRGPGSLAFQPEVAAEGATLTVSGPGGFRSHQEFASAADARFEISGDMADGLYNYELVLHPKVGAGIRRAMDQARRNGDAAAADSIASETKLPSLSGSFTLLNGSIVSDQLVEESSASAAVSTGFEAATGAASFNNVNAAAQVFTTDVIVQGSECVGFDCTASENFGSDTLRLKENNLRIHFDDTSSSGSFPSNDWRIVANDTTNGGASYLSIQDSTAGTTPFRVDAGAGNNAIYVESGGNVGLGNANPAVELHVTDGDSPALRLEQNGSSGFTPQTWDLAGNETNFFVRDVTNGSKLPFKVFPNAPDNSLIIEGSTGDLGVGIQSPTASVDVRRTTGANATMLNLQNNAPVSMVLNNTAETGTWELRRSGSGLSFDNDVVGTDALFNDDGSLRFRRGDGSGASTDTLTMDTAGNVTATSFNPSSDRNLKENFSDVDRDDILQKIAGLPMSRWNFIQDGEGVQHIGPMAQDFHAAFGLGHDERHISTVDADGIALAAIQALYRQLQDKKEEIQTLHQRLEALEAKLAQ